MPDDARLMELTWLSEIEKAARSYGPFSGDSPEERLAIYLLAEGYAESTAPPPTSSGHNFALGTVADPDAKARWQAIERARSGFVVILRITHAGRRPPSRA
jgi:hypothetical protein